VGLSGVKGEPLVTGEFEARGVVTPTIAGLDMLDAVEVVGLVLLDGEDDVPLKEEGVDEGVDEGLEEVGVVDVVSEVLGVEDDSARDAEEWVDEEAGVEDVEEETGVALDDFDVEATEGACESEGVGEEAELGVKEGVLESLR